MDKTLTQITEPGKHIREIDKHFLLQKLPQKLSRAENPAEAYII